MFFLNKISTLVLLWCIQYTTGFLVINKGVKVNYTRKINHFALFFLPMFIDTIFKFKQTSETFIVGSIIVISSLFIYISPIRNRIPIINQMFASFDRPEDRPNTMLWLSTQIVTSYIVIAIFLGFLISYNSLELAFIPILINGIGDGLAEPVGIRFGKHKYRTRALFSKVKYERTLEGSACVFIVSIISVIAFQSYFNMPEFITVLIAMPVLMTLAEAFSPHTWDSPFLYLIGFSILTVVKSGIIF